MSWTAERSDVLDAHAVNTIVDISIEVSPGDPDRNDDPNTLLTDALDPNVRTALGDVVIPFMQDHPGTTPEL